MRYCHSREFHGNVTGRHGDMGPCKELLRNFKENTEEQELEPVLYCTKIGKCTL